MKDIKTLEVTKENEERYLQKISDLEEKVLANMERQGRIGQLFITGKEDISIYIHSENDTVMVAVDENDRVIATTYITQGQKMFSYNDITKYFKVSKEYDEYVRNQYKSEMDYKQDVLKAYEIKMKAYLYAKQKIMQEFPEYKDILEFLESEKQSDGKFDEKSVLREKLISYMSEYIDNEEVKNQENLSELYERFFWMTAKDVSKIIYGENKERIVLNKEVIECENVLALQREHEEILQNCKLKIYEKPQFEQQKYFTANTKNSIELDTYITNPENRNQGLARILVFEGIKKHIKKLQDREKINELFLCSTLHRNNVSSKYVSEFFELKDSLYVNRRQGRDREVHITKINVKDIEKYMQRIQEKLAILHGYKKDEIKVSNERKKEILTEQLQYEKEEFKRLNKIRHSSQNYIGIIKNMQSKVQKIEKLKLELKSIKLAQDKKIEGDAR